MFKKPKQEKAPETGNHLALGRQGEDLAAKYLTGQGLKVLERNVRTPFGEIDIICREKKTIVFVEVKARSSTAFGRPGDAVGPEKQRRLSRAALAYLSEKAWEDRPARFDVLAVSLDGPRPRIDHLADAFDLAAG